MKNKIVFCTLILCAISSALFSQKVKNADLYVATPGIVFTEEQVAFANGVQPALKVRIAGNEDDYAKHFKSWLNKLYLVESKKVNGFLVCPKQFYSGWSADSLILHYRIEREADQCILTLLSQKKEGFVSRVQGPEMAQIEMNIKSQIKEFYIVTYDDVVTGQQKEYERQQKDVEKTQSKRMKLNDNLKDENEKVAEANNKIQSIGLEQNALDQELKVLNATLQQDKKAQDQSQKEVDQMGATVKEKETMYNTMNTNGTLVSKEGKKLTKELAKLRKSQVKLQEKLAESNAKRTKTENAVLKKEESRLKVDSQFNELTARKAKHESSVNEIRAELDKVTNELQEEQRDMDLSLQVLDKLKVAKEGVTKL